MNDRMGVKKRTLATTTEQFETNVLTGELRLLTYSYYRAVFVRASASSCELQVVVSYVGAYLCEAKPSVLLAR